MPGLVSPVIALSLAIAGPPPTIDWRAPAGCPDAAEVTAMTAGLLRAPAGEPGPLEIDATVVAVARRFQLDLQLRSPHGQLRRTLVADDCVLLARAVALVVAVHLDPLAVSRRLPQPAASPPPPAIEVPLPVPPPPLLAPPMPDAAVPVAATREPAPRLSPGTGQPSRSPPGRPPGAHLRLEGGLGYGVAPAIVGELALLAGLGGPRWRVEGGLATAPAREVTSPDGALAGRLRRLAGVLRGCAVGQVGAQRAGLTVLGCLGGEFGALGATGTRGIDAPRTSWTPWAAVLVGPAARVRVAGPLGLLFAVDAVFALTRPTFTAGASPVFPVGPASVRAIVGLDLQFVARKRRARVTQ